MILTIPPLSEFITPDHLEKATAAASNAFYDPALKNSEEDAKEAFQRKVLDSFAEQTKGDVFALVRQALENAYQTFMVMNGQRPANEDGEGTPAQLDWEDKLDDAIALALSGSVREVIGVNWTEEHTVDTRAFDFLERDQLATLTAEKYVKAITERPIPKAMSHFGFVDNPDVESSAFQKVWETIKGEDAKATQMSFQAARRAVEEILISYVHGMGVDNVNLDQMQTLLAQATDRDPLIAAGCILELGGDPDLHHAAFRIYATDVGDDWMSDVISLAIEGELTPMAGDVEPVMTSDTHVPTHIPSNVESDQEAMPEVPPALDRRKGKKGKKPVTIEHEDQATAQDGATDDAEPDSAATGGDVVSQADEEIAANTISSDAALAALRTLRDHTNMADTDIAKRLAVSRASISSYARGKGKFEPDEAQIGELAEMLGDTKTAIDAALMAVTP